jgi:cytochrome c oxidase cbb3-type subunit 3
MHSRWSLPLWACILLVVSVGQMGCRREVRTYQQPPAASQTLNAVQVSGLNPGPTSLPQPSTPAIYEESAYAVSQGQELYEEYNCVGCHAHGGGGIGPALMDNRWIYGSEPQNIFATIMQGRPNGMPAWRNRIPEFQVWEIAAYVRSMSGLLPADIAPARSDSMYVKPAEQSMPRQVPTGVTGAPETKR